ncbi:metalloregulator ArsR/SmtB family transcription factor [Altererythrobacter arenosus]|uniref:Metalloregulator ArsR/SmtB family transcription factor n=1 Tax=Altererythrobacter arenosus TaxID=3032592 RepID=A0ABY8FLV9_9SPHN|nr:metalloregulator ArsR/SmtB family transcription factor [Altererythrobacter sp. CAU 1644]WFL76003.1 metalloregulator ArsR/SmtB family transcription factor [Altererythrobacter sp. CAU 1644]
MNDAAAIASLSALAQDNRLAAFRRLVRAGERGMSAGAIAEALGMAPSSLSFHLAQLSEAGLVTQERQHRTIIYRADYSAIYSLVGYLLENCCEADGCGAAALEALEQAS